MSEKGNSIHRTAVIESGARLGSGVTVGAYAVIGPQVKIADGAFIGPHVVVEGDTTIGERVQIYQFASVGAPPQDLTYEGEMTAVEIGDDTVVREAVTIHRGTPKGGGVTRIGSRCMIMAYSHVAHDCRIGDHVIMANVATLGGHVEIGHHAVIGGMCAIHQFCRIGEFAFMGGMSGTNKDIPPFTRYYGARDGRLFGLNLVGLRRGGFSRDEIKALRDAYRIIFQKAATVSEGVAEAEKAFADVPIVQRFAGFIKESKRGIPTPEWNEEQLS